MPFEVTAIVVLVAIRWLLGSVKHKMPYPVMCTIGTLIVVGLTASCINTLIEDSNFIYYGLPRLL